MKTQLLIRFIGFFILLLILSCRSIKSPDFLGIENPRLESFDLNESTMAMDLDYFNPNKSRLKLKEAEGDAYIDGVMLGHFNLDTLINIPANEKFTLPIKLKVNMKNVLQNSIASFLKTDVLIKLDGKAKVGKGSIFIRYPIRYEGKQNINELMKKVRY